MSGRRRKRHCVIFLSCTASVWRSASPLLSLAYSSPTLRHRPRQPSLAAGQRRQRLQRCILQETALQASLSSSLEEEQQPQPEPGRRAIAASGQQQREALAPSPPPPPRWILLVDDEASIRRAVGAMLSEHGYRVTTCRNGRDALRAALNGGSAVEPSDDADDGESSPSSSSLSLSSLASTTANRRSGGTAAPTPPRIVNVDVGLDARAAAAAVPDAIVSDVRMPVLDGVALLAAVRRHPRLVQIPVVLLTAKSRPEDRAAGYRAGADAYLPKPFDPDELAAIVHNVIARHETLSDARHLGLADLSRDLRDIKRLLMDGGGGVVGGSVAAGSGWVAATSVFFPPDERRILQLLCQGLLTADIAERTFLSTRRVEQLLTAMFRKTNVKNRTELVRWAIATGNVQI